ncbi:hypothetical protein Leucomu_03460 [Leucobacter muris]|uniref:ImmA/IrrE family metallo-endopeptidase n=1 Tax=Leucobacter muris TaxID=1935379 RepID=A0ABX5QDG0_9MICO|nr:hypothetical protein [Leucobacter muris]QAB17099.1 hypothetical protein Leucomu_03460 [Leucobacter muris]
MQPLTYDPAYDPVEHLDRMKIRLVVHSIGLPAIWVPERNMVVRDRGLRADLIRPVLGHECVHVENGDPGGHHPRHEVRSNLHSALRLIDPAEWAKLTASHSDYDRICLELGITRSQFLAYHDHERRSAASRRRLERYGDAIYLEPRMGVGQWAARISA